MASTGEFCGIDPDEMGRLAVSLDGAAARLTRFCHELEVRLQQEKVDVPALREITTIAEWGKSQCSMLLGRADLIRNLGDGAPELGGAVATTGGQGLVHLPDDLESMERAQGLARMYGNDILVNYGGEVQATLIHEHADEIAQLADNPQAAAAFFALLPAKARDSLPNIIAATGSKTAKADLAAFGKALGAALNAPVLVPAFAKVGEDLTKPAGSKIVAWNRLALLKGANAPAKVRSAAARALVLDDFMKNPKQDWRAGSVEARTYGLPTDLVALGLEVLAGDGVAAREAFATMGGPDVKLSQVEKMKRFLDYADHAGSEDDVFDALGRALEAGAGATDEKAGAHSPAASVFAFDVIKVMSPFGDGLPTAARDSMAAIGASYIHELASGARFDKAVDRTSGFQVPDNWVPLPGVTPAFYLSPGDTYRFMKTFVGVEELTDRFDETAAQFRYETLIAAGAKDSQGRTRHFENVAKMFGNLAGLEFKATIDVRGERDATDEMVRGFIKDTASLAIDRIPLKNTILKEGWDLAKTYGVSKLLDGWAEGFYNRVEEATGARADFVLRQKYDMAHLLYESGYPASDPPAELISKDTGSLKTYDELLMEAKREAGEGKKWEVVLKNKLKPYEYWMDGNGRFDTKVEDSAAFQASERPKEEIGIWG
ncbi:hypothetical protein ABT340_16070 [Streptosporangium sp. NPDC000239]|uniref:hypothetical protein n=1 Tax=Streptosporangium sp. NPDC000239 TaxID=3154248 RepID=UPI0033305848